MAKQELIKNWANGNEFDILVTTSALSAGLHYASVYLILHIDAPSGLVDYAQETGQGVRDGQPTECIVLLAPRWKIWWESNYRNNFLFLDCQHIEDYLPASRYLQASLSTYLDAKSSLSFGVICTTF